MTITEPSGLSAAPLRVLQVGCGPRAQSHLGAMRAGGAEPVALCDLDETRLNTTGDKFGVERRYSDMEEAIQTEQPELVDIVTPPTIRLGIVERALAAGAKAILIEKPIALSPSESKRLVELGGERLIAVNTQYQWMPHWQELWGRLRDGVLGEVRLLRASTRTNILEQGPHILDLALRAAANSGLPVPSWVIAGTSGIEHFGATPVPADLTATVGLGDARLHLNAGPSAPAVPGETVIWFQQQIELIGSKGRLWVSLNKGWELWTEDSWERGTTSWPADDQSAQPALFAELRERLRNGTWQEFPTRIAVSGTISDLMFACYASAQGGGRVDMPAKLSDEVVAKLGG
jgi:predicted dehydrogenase